MSQPVTVQKAPDGALQQLIEVHGNRYFADVAEALGGDGAGPDPHELLDSALGACTALTVTMVAHRKRIPLEDVKVTITHEEQDGLYTLERRIEWIGPLTDEQRDYLAAITDKCPIHKALLGRFAIRTTIVG